MGQRRVAVTGLGIVSPFGTDLDDYFARLARGESAIRLYSTDIPRPFALPAVHCAGFDGGAELGRGLAHTMDRCSQLGATAAFAAWQNAGFPEKSAAALPHRNAGVAWGTALGGTLTFEQGYRDLYMLGRERISPLSVVLGMNNAAASHISIQLKLPGPCHTYTIACASAAVAIGEAFHRIRRGEADLMVTGGSDCPLGYGVVRAWEALRVVAPGDETTAHRACRPFSGDRAGLVLGEGAAALVLEDWDLAQARGARIYAEMVGYGTTSDHSHLVKPEAEGQARAIRAALADGDLAPEQVGYVNAHGTATREGDPTEIAALREVFGPLAPDLPVSATKSMHGHLMGATGAVEALVTTLALARNVVPPTAFLDEIDPDCAGVRHVTAAQGAAPTAEAALSNSFAFGGTNAVLAFRRTA